MASLISLTVYPRTSRRAGLCVLNMTSAIRNVGEILDIIDVHYPMLSRHDIVVIEEVGTPKRCYIMSDGDYTFLPIDCTNGFKREFQVLFNSMAPTVDFWTNQFYPYVNQTLQYIRINLTEYIDQLEKNQTEDDDKEQISFFHPKKIDHASWSEDELVFVKLPKGKTFRELIFCSDTSFRLDPKVYSHKGMFGNLIHLELPANLTE